MENIENSNKSNNEEHKNRIKILCDLAKEQYQDGSLLLAYIFYIRAIFVLLFKIVIPKIFISLFRLVIIILVLGMFSITEWLKISASPHYDKAKIAYNKGDKENAWEHFKLALSEYRANSIYYNAKSEEDDKRALRLYRKAAEKNSAKALNSLGVFFYDGKKGLEQNYDSAAKYYRKAAELGYHWGEFNIGRCYYEGNGVEQNYKEAVKWFKLAAEQKNDNSYGYLGNCYQHGYGVEQNYDEAIKWYKLVANEDNPIEMNNLGLCYYDIQNYTEAVKWFTLAANAGIVASEYNLGYCYYYGNGVKKDLKKAKELLESAAKKGYKSAMEMLESTSFTEEAVESNGGNKKAKEKSQRVAANNNEDELKKKRFVLLYNYAVDTNDPEALNSLGDCYYHGDGVKRNYDEAAIYYRKSAKLGNDKGEYNLGRYYLIFKSDYKEAIKWLRLSAEKNNASAIKALGDCYFSGWGVKQNKEEAIKYYMLAAEQNDLEALNTLGYCYYSGTGVLRNYEKAVKYFRQSAELGNDKGELNLGNCYYGGKGIKKDLKKAKELFESAARKGNKEAKDILKVMKF